VKAFAQANPHRMGDWSPDSKTRVASMSGNDFFSNEKSATLDKAGDGEDRPHHRCGEEIVLKDGLSATLEGGRSSTRPS
jgi:isocitrate dehydrogenase